MRLLRSRPATLSSLVTPLALLLLASCGKSEEPQPPGPDTTRSGGRSGSTRSGGASGSNTGGSGSTSTGGSGPSTSAGGAAGSAAGGAAGSATGSGGASGSAGTTGGTDAAPSAGDGAAAPGLGGLGPGSADDSPPLVLPGSKLIFDGKTLMGWNPCDASRWSVKDGAIDGNGSGNNFCQTETDHDTFRITGKSRMVRDPSNHAGICIWGNRGAGGGGCLQMTPVSGSLWDYGGGGGVRTLPRSRPYDKWNFFEILVDLKTGKIDIAVEGQAFPTYMDRRLGSRKKGPIGLQLHAGNNEVQYKDLAVEDNPTVMKLLTAK